MNFIYDILVNFNNDLYDFFEWNINDDVSHIRKMPLVRVDTDILTKLMNFDIKCSKDVLKKFENKAEKFTNHNTEKIQYAILFSDCQDVLALTFNEYGQSTHISKLLIDEQEEVIDACGRCDKSKFEFTLLKPREFNNFKTRKQQEKSFYLLNALNKLEKNQEIDKLKYLYFECFNEKQSSIDIIISKLKEVIEIDKYEKIMFNFFKLISIN